MLEKCELVLRVKELEEKRNSNNATPQYSSIVNDLEKTATDLLATVCEFMPEYTKHSIDHSFNVLKIIEKILPDINILNYTETVLIIYAAVLHDIGMVASRDEIKSIKESDEYKSLLAEYQYDVQDEDVVTEFIRRNHVKRSMDFIDKAKRKIDVYKLKFDVDDVDFSYFLKDIIYSHGVDVKELYDDEKYPCEILLGEEYVNIKYLCVILRLADVLDFDKTRTPKYMYEHIGIKNEISLGEWKKHLSVEGHYIGKDKIEFRARCTDAVTERTVKRFLEYIEKERSNDIKLLKKSDSKKQLELINPILYKVDNDGSYIYTDVQFDFDYKKILNILMGTYIYSSSEIFLREVLQNAYDACNTRKALEKKYNKSSIVSEIKIAFDSENKIFSVTDNGIGMSEEDIVNYVVKIGRSYYESKQFFSEQLEYNPISHFGIGMLSCFMVSDEIQIESLKYSTKFQNTKAVNIKLKINDSFIESYPAVFDNFGTKISLKIRNDFAENLSFNKIVEMIENSMSYQSIPIEVKCDENTLKLEKSSVTLKKELEGITGIQVIEIITDLVEGYIVLYNYQHQALFNDSKLCQQEFKIISNDRNNNLKPDWVRFMGYNLNIKKKYLTLNTSREKVVENDNFRDIKFIIEKHIIEYYKSKPQDLYPFLVDGRTNALSNIKQVNEFLANVMSISVYYNDKYSQVSLRYLLEFLNGKRINIALIDRDVNNYFKNNKEKYSEFKLKYFILLNNNNAYWLIQYVFPYIEQKEEMIHTYPGVVYTEYVMNMEKGYEIPVKSVDYLWRSDKCADSNLFCYILNDRLNLLEITLNKNNQNATLLINNSKDIRVKSLEGVILKNIRQRVLNHQYANQQIVDYGGQNIDIWGNNYVPSFLTVGCLENDFAELLNKFIHEKYTSKELDEMGIQNLCFTKENFISWWYKN